ncbi:MAG TPA: UDP-2,3-diacylglucosamine diphosphatase LpxI [Rhizomicrobium sp.]|nr:UDP-2,3-diacylglucosamine diphosphatase LpxI [Rhizomicrobium sp.]
MTALGIIAGGGDLPIAVAESAQEAGRAVFVVALRGMADDTVARFPHDWAGIGEVGKTLKLLRAHACTDIILVGRVARPRFAELKLDTKGLLLLPKVIAAARQGDDALLRTLVTSFEDEGFRTVGVADAAPGLLAREGVLGRVRPSAEIATDIALAVKVVRTLGSLDIGQAAAVCDGLVLAVEAAEGTDAMIARAAGLPNAIRGTPASRRGVLVKALKPAQDGKTDLPVIGVATVRNVAAAGFAGIAIEAGRSLVINRQGIIEAADAAGIFVTAFAPDAYPG